MSKGKMEKTNALRLLDRMKIPYEAHTYPCEEFTDGLEVAKLLGLPPHLVCKTLVTVGKSGGHYVFVLPVDEELDRKKAAMLVGEKSLEMLHVKDLLSTTGYIRGGCTALGMKKHFPTVVDESVRDKEIIYVSGGKRGLQLSLSPQDLVKAAGAMWGDVIAR
jgi:Cys-tRNA(Pro)/Cys-tRNA(Cys) deacylase